MAGVDMSMVPLDFSFYNLTLANVQDGSIPRTRLDDAVRRILRVKYALGLFNGRTAWPNSSASSDFNRPEYFTTQLEASRQVMTLLKNTENVLPLDYTKITETNKLIITGPTSNTLSSLNGGWSYKDDQSYPENYTNKTILESFGTRLGSSKIDYYNSSSFNQLYNIDNLLNESKTASYILVCLGERAYKETEGNIYDLTLDDAQLELVERINNTTQTPIILALAQGRPRLIHRIVDLVSSIIMMFLPGMEGYGFFFLLKTFDTYKFILVDKHLLMLCLEIIIQVEDYQ
jgi:beta-glucosidase